MDSMEFARQLIRHMTANKNTLYVFCPYNLGDFLINGGLCHALLKKKRKQSCILIVRDRFANCGLNFVGVAEVRYIPQLLMDFIREYICATCEYETDNYIYGHFHEGQVDGWDGNESFINNYRKSVFGLPLETELIPPLMEPPSIYQKQRLHDKYFLNKKHTIILAPYANSISNLDETFWARLATELIGKDYVLYTNVSNPREKVIQGTAPMTTTFSEVIYLAEKVNCFIGMRSGLFDLLAFTNARLLYVLTGMELWYYDLKFDYSHLNGRAFYILNANEWERLKVFLQQKNLSSIDNLILDNRIFGRDLALNYEHLLEKILGAVEREES